MEKEFIPYELALKLKTLGFDEPCFGFYLEDGTWTPASYSREGTVYPSNTDLLPEWCAAPLYQQAFRWFREKYGLLSYVDKCLTDTFRYNLDLNGSMIGLSGHKTHEEAELACLIKLIQIVKEKKNG